MKRVEKKELKLIMKSNNPTRIRKIDRLINCLPKKNTNQPNEVFFEQDYIPKLKQEFKTNGITVYYDNNMDGGGTSFGLQYVPVIKQLYPDRIFDTCYEWCSGPGFIGFDILSHQLCRNLWLGDIFKPSLRSVEKTIANLPPEYANCVTPIHIKDQSEIPETVKFDLVVSNPPHWNNNLDTLYSQMSEGRVSCDQNWTVHQNFFKNIKKNLATDGVILLQEQTYASAPSTFQKWIDEAGLSIVGCWWNQIWTDYYYLEIKHKED